MSLPKDIRSHQVANRAFRYLYEHGKGMGQDDVISLWNMLVMAVQAQCPEWSCIGPTRVKGGTVVYYGPNGYMMAVRLDGSVLLGRSHKIPNLNWKPRYESMLSLCDYLTIIKTKA